MVILNLSSILSPIIQTIFPSDSRIKIFSFSNFGIFIVNKIITKFFLLFHSQRVKIISRSPFLIFIGKVTCCESKQAIRESDGISNVLAILTFFTDEIPGKLQNSSSFFIIYEVSFRIFSPATIISFLFFDNSMSISNDLTPGFTLDYFHQID